MIERIPSGVKGLDELLDGGIPVDSWLLLIINVNTDRFRIISPFLKAGLENNEGIIFCNVLKSVQEIRKLFEYYGINISKYESKGQIVFVNSYSKVVNDKNVFNVSSGDYFELSCTINTAMAQLSNWNNIRAVCPSTGDALFTLNKESVFKFANSRREMRSKFSSVSLHTLIKGTRDDLIESLTLHADGVIEIESIETSEETKYYLRIRKMKYTKHPTKQYELKVVNNNFELITT